MKKLRLELEELSVESFETAGDASPARGTVRGQIAYFVSRYRWQCQELTWDLAQCWTADVEQGTCQPVYTCPECASPPQTYDVCDTVNTCPVDIG